jgi:gamma-glutamyltranspeptidase / glutathione hydrolase
MKGVVAAGHPLTAEAGADALRRGGNAVDAAVCAVLTSFAVESPLTGLGAGGFMLVHAGGENVLLDFFVEAPGRGGVERRGELVPIDVYFDAQTPQTFNVGAVSCGVPGTPAGLAHALARFGTMPMTELVAPAVRYARDGVPLNEQQAFVCEILAPILTHTGEGRRLYAPEGRILREGESFHFPELGDALERLAAEGPELFYGGEVGTAIADHVRERGGTLTREDMRAYEAVERRPVRARFRGVEVLTNPPPSSGGILIAHSLELLDRLGGIEVQDVIAVMRAAQEERGEEFMEGLYREGFTEEFLDPPRLDEIAARLRRRPVPPAGPAGGDVVGSTTHLAAMDAEGNCATVTCSNGTGSGEIVPGTGVHVNNMLGEQDLNPLGFHLTPPGRRMPSMMAPTIVLRDGSILAGLGSAGSNRIRSAILQTVIGLIGRGLDIGEAIEAGRVHFEDGVVQAEPGVDEAGLRALEAARVPVTRWQRPNLFFGGVQAVTRDSATGLLRGAGDPRRGGAAVVV